MLRHARALPALVFTCAAALSPAKARAQDLWSVTLYGGPTTDTFTSDIITGHLHIIGGMAGIAVNRKLAYLGAGFSLMAEGQATQYFIHDAYQSVSLGIGVSFDRFPWKIPTTLSLYAGPSYAFDPPPIAGIQHRWLNYVSAEFAVQLPGSNRWDAVLRLFHRSGAWGLYAQQVDQGTMVGAGLRLRL